MSQEQVDATAESAVVAQRIIRRYERIQTWLVGLGAVVLVGLAVASLVLVVNALNILEAATGPDAQARSQRSITVVYECLADHEDRDSRLPLTYPKVKGCP